MAKKTTNKTEEEVVEVAETTVAAKAPKKEEKMYSASDVKSLMKEMMEEYEDSKKAKAPKRVGEQERLLNISRFQDLNDNNTAKWVVGWVDRNTDPYVKEPIYAYKKFNANTRETEAWMELIFHDGKTLEVPVRRYVGKRLQIQRTAASVKTVDKSYSEGEVPVTKEIGDKYIPTGMMQEQLVEVTERIFTFELDGEKFEVAEKFLA